MIVKTLEDAPRARARRVLGRRRSGWRAPGRRFNQHGGHRRRKRSSSSRIAGRLGKPAEPQFIEKVRDVVGLYLNPPERAVVLCVDEKSQIQALDRTAPILPMLPGTPQRATHDYKRAGSSSSLYAALDITSGKVIGRFHSRHRAIEFKQFLATLERGPAELDVHVVLDNSSTHKTPAIQKWLLAHPRFVLHFTPTSSSWLNLVERWFAELTTKKLRRGAHRSVRALNADIRAWIETWNDDPKPYVWTKTGADQILESSPPTAPESTNHDTSSGRNRDSVSRFLPAGSTRRLEAESVSRARSCARGRRARPRARALPRPRRPSGSGCRSRRGRRPPRRPHPRSCDSCAWCWS